MQSRSYGGGIRPEDISRVLMAGFNNDRYQATQVTEGEQGRVLHIIPRGASATSLTVRLSYLDGSTQVELGEADGKWVDVASDVGTNLVGGAAALLQGGKKPGKGSLPLLAAAAVLSSLPKTVRTLRLDKKIWFIVEETVTVRLKHLEAARRLLTCKYCEILNQPGAEGCHSCGAPLHRTIACEYCQLANPVSARTCLSCGGILPQQQLLVAPTPVARVCADCGQPAEKEDAFCAECGQKLR